MTSKIDFFLEYLCLITENYTLVTISLYLYSEGSYDFERRLN